MLFYINTSEHEFGKWRDSFFQNTPLGPLLPPNSRLILGAPQLSISRFREPEIIVPAKRLNEQSQNASANVSEQDPWVIKAAAKMENYIETINALSILIKPIGLGQRVLVSVVEDDQDMSRIAQTIADQICERWTDTLLQAENTPPIINRDKFYVTIKSIDSFKDKLTSFADNFQPYENIREIHADEWNVGRARVRNAEWNTFLPKIKNFGSHLPLTVDNEAYRQETSRAWVLTVNLVEVYSNAVLRFEINVGITHAGTPDNLHWMVWDYPKAFSAEYESVLQKFLYQYQRWKIEKVEPSANADAANGTADVLSKKSDKGGKKKESGRHRDPDYEWAREQVYNLGRPRKEVYKEWLERNNSDRATRLSDAKDSFDKLLRDKPKGT